MAPKRPKRPPAGKTLRAIDDDPVIVAMRAAAPSASNAEVLEAVHLYTGAPLYGFSVTPKKAIETILARPRDVSPERARIEALGAAKKPAHSVPATRKPSWLDRFRGLFL